MRGGDRNSRLRVLSPVSQPEEEEDQRYRHADDTGQEATDDDEDEEYEEARDSLYENQEPEHDHASTNTDTRSGTEHTASHGDDRSHRHRRHQSKLSSGASSHSQSDPHNLKNSPWRRRVELALTKMTAEIAAVREQMEARTLANRRRNGIWAWLKWIVWTILRQILWDLAMLGALLIFMRLRGDRRVENRLRSGWSELKSRLARFKLLGRVGDMPVLP